MKGNRITQKSGAQIKPSAYALKGVQKQGEPEERTQRENARHTILVVDSDPGVLEILERILESENYQVMVAKSGREAAGKVVSDTPDLVLLDWNMPERDDWPAFQLMRARQMFLPIIMISARSNQYGKVAECGVDAFMEKPLDMPVLLKAIKGFLAEDEGERIRRLSDPRFETVFLRATAEKE